MSSLQYVCYDDAPAGVSHLLTFIKCRDVNVVVSVFDSLAFAFHSKLDGYGRKPRIVLVTGINPKIFSGKRAYKHCFITC